MKNFVSWRFEIDESTNVKDAAQLAMFIIGVDKELNETEKLLSLRCMKNTTIGANIFFEVLNAFDKFGLDLSTLCGIATDGARTMSGTCIGFVSLLESSLKEKNVSDNIAIFHCIILQQNLCANSLKFKHIMDPVIKAVNFIRARGLHHRQFLNFLGTESADQLEKLFNEFSARFKDFKIHEHLFKIFSLPFHTDIDKAPTDIQIELIDLQERTDLKAKYVEMNLGDFYRKYLYQDKVPNLRKYMTSKMAFFGSTYLCEQFFSKMGFMKFPYRSVMTDEHLENRLRVASTSIK